MALLNGNVLEPARCFPHCRSLKVTLSGINPESSLYFIIQPNLSPSLGSDWVLGVLSVTPTIAQ